MRHSIVAGMFYPENFEELNKTLEQCFKEGKGPAVFPSNRKNNIKAIITPHAGYTYSGQCAAWAYKEIGEAEFPDLFIILGSNHTGIGSDVAVSLEDWKTPLGVVNNHTKFSKELLKNPLFVHDESAHSQEHSIEVQLPFLQFANKDHIHNISFVPIILKNMTFEKCREVSEKIESVAEKLKLKIIIIASSDFTHYGADYHYVPFIEDVPKNIYDLDALAIGFIKKLDAIGLYNQVIDNDMTICGFLPITVAIDLAKLMFAKKAELLNYYTSGDLTGSYRTSVSYAAIVMK